MRHRYPALVATLLALSACSPPAAPGADAALTDAFAADTQPESALVDAPPEAAVPTRGAGVTTRHWVDTTRATPANGDAGASSQRVLTTEIWYPATVTAPASETRDAPLDPAAAPYPLVLFVHGSSSSGRQSTYLTRALAVAGYVVASADFPLTTLLTPGGPSDLHIDDEVGDLGFVTAQLALAAHDASDPLHGAVDARRFVVVAHSTGGAVALLSQYAPALRAAGQVGTAVLSPRSCYFASDFFAGNASELLVVSATQDRFVPPAINGDRVYALATGGPRTLVTLAGATHLGFTDANLPDDVLNPVPTRASDALAAALRAYGDSSGCSPAPPDSADALMPFATQHALTVAWVRAFLDRVLRAQPAALDALRARPQALVSVQSSP